MVVFNIWLVCFLKGMLQLLIKRAHLVLKGMLQLLIEKAHLILKDYSYCESKNFYIIIISQWWRNNNKLILIS